MLICQTLNPEKTLRGWLMQQHHDDDDALSTIFMLRRAQANHIMENTYSNTATYGETNVFS